MGLAEDVETIKEYIQWKAIRMDQSPEAFVLDRAKRGAYERLEAALEFLSDYGDPAEDDMSAEYIDKLRAIMTEN